MRLWLGLGLGLVLGESVNGEDYLQANLSIVSSSTEDEISV